MGFSRCAFTHLQQNNIHTLKSKDLSDVSNLLTFKVKLQTGAKGKKSQKKKPKDCIYVNPDTAGEISQN